eukprot:1152030-Pelagomonas_calceolata.AAC.13
MTASQSLSVQLASHGRQLASGSQWLQMHACMHAGSPPKHPQQTQSPRHRWAAVPQAISGVCTLIGSLEAKCCVISGTGAVMNWQAKGAQWSMITIAWCSILQSEETLIGLRKARCCDIKRSMPLGMHNQQFQQLKSGPAQLRSSACTHVLAREVHSGP